MHGKKVLITGANGMLGSSLLNFLQGKDVIGLSSTELDITKAKLVQEKLNDVKPDIIIHTAAFTDVESCQTEPDKAYLINTLGTQNLVNYCVGKDVLFVYISSTGIYGNTKQDLAYTEFDHTEPTTIHHQSKHEGEKAVQNHLNKHLIIRTGWLFGGDVTHQKNFVYKRFLEAKEKEILFSNKDQIGNPTAISSLIKQILLLIDKKQYGIFNCVDKAENISRYDYVKKIVELFGIECTVKVASKEMFNRIAPVSQNESALNYKLDLLGLNIMKPWDKSLQEYIASIKEVH